MKTWFKLSHWFFAYSVFLMGIHLWGTHQLGSPVIIRPYLASLAFFGAFYFGVFVFAGSEQGAIIRQKRYVPMGMLLLLGSPLFAWEFPGFLVFLLALLGVYGWSKSLAQLPPYKAITLRSMVAPLAVIVSSALFALLTSLYVNGELMAYSVMEHGAPAVKVGLNGPVFSEQAALTGTLHRDLYFHNAIVEMIKEFGAFSPGLDGFSFGFHHYAGHLLFAAWSRYLDMPAIASTAVLQACVLIPVIAFMTFVAFLCASQTKKISATPLGVLGIALVALILGGHATVLTSVTFAPALCVVLAFTPFFFRVFAERTGRIWEVTVLLLSATLVFLTKMHAGSAFLVLIGAGIWRRYLPEKWFLVGLGLGAPVAFYVGVKVISGVYPSTWPSYLVHYPQYLMLLAPGMIFLLFSMGDAKAQIHGSAWLNAIKHYGLSLTILVLVLHLASGSSDMIWFASVAYFLLAIMIALYLEAGIRVLTWIDRRLLLMAGVALGVGALYQPALLTLNKLRYAESVIASHVGKASAIAQTIGYIETHQLRAKDTLTFIPPDHPLWSYGELHNSRSFYLPAIMGMPLIFGLPPDQGAGCVMGCNLSTYGYGFSAYGDGARSRAGISDQELCERATLKEFKAVLILLPLAAPEISHRIVPCHPPVSS